MELFGLISIPTWLVVLILIFTVIHVYFSWNFGTLEAMGIPTPKPLPIFGNLFLELSKLIHESDVELSKKYGRTHGFYFTRIPTIRSSDPDFIKAVCVKEFNSFTDHMKFDMKSIDPVMNKFITQLSGDEWRTTRNLLTPSFTGGKLRQMMPLLEKCVKSLVDILGEQADKGNSVAIKTKFMAYLTDVIATCAFGLELDSQTDKKHQTFVHHAQKLVANQSMFLLILAFILPTKIIRLLKINIMDRESLQFFKSVVMDIIKIRQTQNIKRNDFLQLMLDAAEDKSDATTDPSQPKKLLISQDVIVAQSILFLFAGFETTGSTISFVTYNLAVNPDCQEKLYDEVMEALKKNEGKVDYEVLSQMQYLEMVIYETLRMYPPAIRTDRMCTQDCVVNGIPIKKGMPIAVNIYSAMNDEEFYENPKKFDPERFSPENKEARNNFTFLAFGVGPRNCIGMRFALMEMKFTLVHLIKNFRFVPSKDTQIPLRFHKSRFNLLPVEPISLKFERRN